MKYNNRGWNDGPLYQGPKDDSLFTEKELLVSRSNQNIPLYQEKESDDDADYKDHQEYREYQKQKSANIKSGNEKSVETVKYVYVEKPVVQVREVYIEKKQDTSFMNELDKAFDTWGSNKQKKGMR